MNEPRISLEEMQNLRGEAVGRATSFPIDPGDVRRFAAAVYWPEVPPRHFWDVTYAAASCWQGIVAPREFNPFAWPLEGPGRRPVRPPKIDRARTFNGGTSQEYGVRMRPGDRITAVDRIADVVEKSGRSGLLVFAIAESLWTNQTGAFVARKAMTYIQVLDN